MLLVAEKDREREVLDVFKKWGLDAVVVGTVTDGGLATIRNHKFLARRAIFHCLDIETLTASRLSTFRTFKLATKLLWKRKIFGLCTP
jgi:phosphoribosylformylglycinamidine (FGAM) synthase-like enzyme